MNRRLIWATIGCVAIVLALAYTLPYGSLNQATYLLDPLQRAMPELFRRDWFVSETPPYLPVFGWLARWLYAIDSEGAVAVLAAHVVVTCAMYAALYWLVSSVQDGWRAAVILVSWVTVSKGLSLGNHYLLVGYLQPSSLSTLGWIVAMAAFARDRFLASGLAAAAAGALHANFLVLGVGLFAFTAVLRRGLRLRDYVELLAPQLVVLAVFAPSLLDAAGPSEHAVWILTHFHAPAHYAPERLAHWLLQVVGWQIGGIAGYYVLRDVKAARTLFWFSVASTVVVVGSTLLVRYTPLVSLTQARWGRIGPFGQLASIVLMLGALVRIADGRIEPSVRVRVLVALGMLVPLYVSGRYLRTIIGWPAMGVAAVLLVLAFVPRRPIARASVAVLAVLAFAYAVWKSPRGTGLTTRPVGSDPELELAQWIRGHTAVDALFLAPPMLSRFRLLTRRAQIADTKSPPLRPDLLEQWHARLTAMVQMPDAPDFRATEQKYWTMQQHELEQVARQFDADYIVVSANGQPFSYAPVFANAEFNVYRVQR